MKITEIKNQKQLIEILEFEKKYFNNHESYSLKQLTEMINIPYSIVGISKSNKLVSYLIYQKIDQELEIIKIFTDPDYQKKGLASLLMQYCFLTNNKTCWLEVNEKNTNAIKFYLHLGFKINHKRPKYYFQDAAIVMKKVL